MGRGALHKNVLRIMATAILLLEKPDEVLHFIKKRRFWRCVDFLQNELLGCCKAAICHNWISS